MSDIETIRVPLKVVDLARRRTRDLVLASIHFPNALECMVLSAYLQGLEDGADTVTRRAKPEHP